MTPRSINEALEVALQFTRDGLQCSLGYLPITRSRARSVFHEVSLFMTVLARIDQHNVRSDITLKLQQLGIHAGEALARQATLQIAAHAADRGTFVWIDMGLPHTVDATIRIFREAHRRFGNVGICLQAYLARTERDLHCVLEDAVPVRLVKGFYADHDLEPWSAVTENYSRLMEYALHHSAYPAIATHDAELITKARQIISQDGVRSAEFQFFRGVRDTLARKLVRDGFNARIYIPFGNVWRFLLSGIGMFDTWHQLERMAGMQPRP